jgi:hypothetical protein
MTYRIKDLATGTKKWLVYYSKNSAKRISRQMNRRVQQHRFEVVENEGQRHGQ